EEVIDNFGQADILLGRDVVIIFAVEDIVDDPDLLEDVNFQAIVILATEVGGNAIEDQVLDDQCANPHGNDALHVAAIWVGLVIIKQRRLAAAQGKAVELIGHHCRIVAGKKSYDRAIRKAVQHVGQGLRIGLDFLRIVTGLYLRRKIRAGEPGGVLRFVIFGGQKLDSRETPRAASAEEEQRKSGRMKW